MSPEWAEEIWRQFNSRDNITKHAAMWNAECTAKYLVQKSYNNMKFPLSTYFPLLLTWTSNL